MELLPGHDRVTENEVPSLAIFGNFVLLEDQHDNIENGAFGSCGSYGAAFAAQHKLRWKALVKVSKPLVRKIEVESLPQHIRWGWGFGACFHTTLGLPGP